MRLLRLTVIVWLLLIAMIGGGVLYGRAQPSPNPLEALGFGMCDGRPCFLGITPGVTTWEDARRNLENQGAQRLASDVEGQYHLDSLSVYVMYSGNTHTVTSLFVHEDSSIPLPATIGDIVPHWGFPCGYTLDAYPYAVYLIYPTMTVALSLADQRISPSTPIRFIIFPAYESCDDTAPWPGFTSSNRYNLHYVPPPR